MRARAHFSRSSRRWRWSLVCRANWRLSNVAAPYNARLRRHLRVRARRVHPAEIRVEYRAGSRAPAAHGRHDARSEEHTSELQSHSDLVCRLLLEKKKKIYTKNDARTEAHYISHYTHQ